MNHIAIDSNTDFKPTLRNIISYGIQFFGGLQHLVSTEDVYALVKSLTAAHQLKTPSLEQFEAILSKMRTHTVKGLKNDEKSYIQLRRDDKRVDNTRSCKCGKCMKVNTESQLSGKSGLAALESAVTKRACNCGKCMQKDNYQGSSRTGKSGFNALEGVLTASMDGEGMLSATPSSVGSHRCQHGRRGRAMVSKGCSHRFAPYQSLRRGQTETREEKGQEVNAQALLLFGSKSV